MRITRIELTCDRCKKIITGNYGYGVVKIDFIVPHDEDGPHHHVVEDICEECLGRVYEVLHKGKGNA